MKTRMRTWLIVVSTALLVLPVTFAEPADNQPQYEGKSLDFWLDQVFAPATRDAASNAFSHMQPSPAPLLVKMMQDSPQLRKGEAIHALIMLGPSAKSVAPDLGRMLADAEYRDVQAIAAILSSIGADGAPVLIEALKKMPLPALNTPQRERMRMERIRGDLVLAIGRCGLAARPAISIFQNDLKNGDDRVRNRTVIALGGLAAEPDVAAILINCMNDTDETTRRNAARGLANPVSKRFSRLTPDDFDPLTNSAALPPPNTNAVAALFRMAESDSSYNCRWTATDSLMKMDPKGALDGFIKDLTSPDLTTRRNGARNLMYFKKGGRSAIPSLIKCMSDADAKVRRNAAVSLREIGEQPDVVVPVLMKSLSNPDAETRVMAGIALGAFGNAAKAAVSNIIDIINHDTNELSEEGLFNALDRIDPAAAEQLWRDYRKKHPPVVEPAVPPREISPDDIR